MPVGRWGLRTTAILYLGLLIALPAAAVVSKGFSHGLVDLKSAIGSPGAAAALKLTLSVSVITALINAVFGTLIAWVLVRYRFPGRAVISGIVDLPFAIPTLVTGVMLVALYGPSSPVGAFFERHGIHVVFAPIGITLALLFVTLPFVVRTVQPVLLELDRDQEDAARVLGAGRIRTFTKIVFPQIREAVAAGTLLSFARSLGEFGAVVIVAGNIMGKTLTAPVFIYQLTSQFRYPEAAAVASVLFAVSFLVVLAVDRLIGRWGIVP
ncbi:MAG: sulfate/thiosulfate transport system permease protein [Actinomycetota bacterium]|nr:sulfate/thiosulfate transport system permease protein [Actinomycetota bacterium]